MTNRFQQQRRYTWLYWGYWFASLVLLVVAGVLVVRYYCTAFQEKVTISHLFLVVIILLVSLFLRLNALHYHRLLVEATNQPPRGNLRSRTKGREGANPYER